VLHRDGASSRIATAAGMIWAVNAGADIINASLSAPTYSVLERTAIRYAEKRGVLVVVAAGNVAGSRARYPASLPNVASVTALDREGRVASWATRNASTDLAAFGEDVPVLIAGGGHRTARGTSYAAPRIAAAAARLLVARPDLTLPQLRRLLRDQYSPPVQRAV
jgi:subtilisin family serine protease